MKRTTTTVPREITEATSPDEFGMLFTDVECVTLKYALGEAAVSNAVLARKFERAGLEMQSEQARKAETMFRSALQSLEDEMRKP